MKEKTIMNINGAQITLERVKARDDGNEMFLSPMLIEIVLRKLKNAQRYDEVCRVMNGLFPDCKRENVPEIVERLKVFDTKGIGGAFDNHFRHAQIIEWLERWNNDYMPKSEKVAFEMLSPYIPKASLDLLLEQLPTIMCRDLKRFLFDRYYRCNMSMKEFFGICESIVPQRKGTKGWNYENFKKG